MPARSPARSNFNDSFDGDAEGYHAVRPGYPAEMYEELRTICGLDTRSRLLEIGAGSGIATIELAKFGAQVVAIEPGERLAAIAKQGTKRLSNVEVFVGTYETYRDPRPFDAVVVFTAFHWLDEQTKFQSVADHLTNDGSLVLVWNSYFQSDTPVTADVNAVYQECLSEEYPGVSTTADVNRGVLQKLRTRESEVLSSPLFDPVRLQKHLTFHAYNDRTYPQLLATFPVIAKLEPIRRKRFLEQVTVAVKRHGTITVPVLTTFIVSRKHDGYLRSIGHQ